MYKPDSSTTAAIKMATSFLDNAHSTFEGYEITDTQISALKDYLEGHITVDLVPKRLTSHPEESSNPIELLQRIGGLWTLLNETAVAVPSSQEAIVSVLRAIRTLPQAQVPKGEGEDVYDFDDGYYWRELTEWANNWADTFNRHAADCFNSKAGEEGEKAKADYISACAFTARLAATNEEALSSYGAALERAASAISWSLEVEAVPSTEPERLKAAAQLFMYAAPELHRYCKEGKKLASLDSPIGSVWKGKNGFSLERWKFWADRLNELAEKEDLSDDARTAAKQAREAMERVGDV